MFWSVALNTWKPTTRSSSSNGWTRSWGLQLKGQWNDARPSHGLAQGVDDAREYEPISRVENEDTHSPAIGQARATCRHTFLPYERSTVSGRTSSSWKVPSWVSPVARPSAPWPEHGSTKRLGNPCLVTQNRPRGRAFGGGLANWRRVWSRLSQLGHSRHFERTPHYLRPNPNVTS